MQPVKRAIRLKFKNTSELLIYPNLPLNIIVENVKYLLNNRIRVTLKMFFVTYENLELMSERSSNHGSTQP